MRFSPRYQSRRSALEPTIPRRQKFEPQCIELNESCCVLLIIGACVFLECHMGLGVKRMIGPAADAIDRTFVKLQPHGAGHMLLDFVDGGLQHLALGREPEAVIDQLRVTRHNRILQVARTGIERDLFDPAMRL